LVTTDFSSASEAASVHGLAIALRLHGRLTLLHTGSESRDAVPWDRFPDVRSILVRWGLIPGDASGTAITEMLDVEVAKRAIRDEDPRQGIIDYLRHRPADVLVMATECRDGRERLLSPSVSESVGFESKTPTLLLPRRGQALVDPEHGNWSLRRVLCAVDPQADARTTMALLGRWLTAAGTAPIAVTVVDIRNAAPAPGLGVLPDVAAISWERVHSDDLSADTIVAVAQEQAADLLLVQGVNPRSMSSRLRGTVIDRVCNRLHIPILMVPPA
jgi:nucleotide-binding universal stress UspA family protein